MSEFQRNHLAVSSADDLMFGTAPRPVSCGHGVTLGAGTVIPEINFTLPPMEIAASTWPDVRRQYAEIIEGVCRRAVALEVPALLVEFETLPPMTVNPAWALEMTELLAETLDRYHNNHGLASALRLTPNDTREHERPPVMRSGKYWDGMRTVFHGAAGAGADMLAIESTGGKEIHDEALMNADLAGVVFALGVVAPRDMSFLWREIVSACREGGIIPAGDTACGFGNTAMVLADQRMIPSVFAAVVRVATVPRTLVAIREGAVGPGKDCAYENPYLKAIAGIPISMEGRSAACAHLSHVGNVAQAVADVWSNESVQNVRLLSAEAPVVSMEQLAYDCRLMNTAMAEGRESASRLQRWLVDSDASLNPQAWVLRPDVVCRLSREIVSEETPYRQTRKAVMAATAELTEAHAAGRLKIAPNEVPWLRRLSAAASELPETEEEMIAATRDAYPEGRWLPGEYEL